MAESHMLVPMMGELSRSRLKHTCSWHVNLLYYEYWTDKQKYFYVLIVLVDSLGAYGGMVKGSRNDGRKCNKI